LLKANMRRMALRIMMALVATVGFTAAIATPASASAQTCISANQGYVCTNVVGSGTWVSQAGVSRGKSPGSICNYSAWFFYVPPSGGAYDLGYQSRQGCTVARAWFDIPVNRNFQGGTLVCAKWMEDYGTKIAEKCVGVG
jgi:hypothetical protein